MFGLFRRRGRKVDDMIRRADALRDTQQFAEAATAYAAVVPLAPRRFDLIVQQANMLKDSGQLDEAARTYTRALQHLPDDADIRVQLGHLARLRRDLDGARAAYRAALRCRPPSLVALSELRTMDDGDGIARNLTPDGTATLLALGGTRAARALPPGCWQGIRRSWDVPPPPEPSTPAITDPKSLAQGGSALLLVSPGATLHLHAADWFAYAAHLTADHGWIADSEVLDTHGAPYLPLLRDRPDRHAMTANRQPLGAVMVPASALHGHGNDSLEDVALRLARAGRLSHIPLPLTAFASQPPTVAPPAPAPAARLTGEIGVIIPTRNGGADVARFVQSLRDTAETPGGITVLVIDNGSDDPETLAHVARLAGTPATRVLRIDEPFNWSGLNNTVAAALQTDILLFANDDMRMLSPGWDGALRRRLADTTVGAVGARLVYPDGRVQHAGMLAGWDGELIHDGLGAAGEDPGPGHVWMSPHETSAVTGAFLAVRNADFQRLGGFDAARFAVSFGDVDLCYRLRASGLAVLYEPAIVAEHFESKTRGRDDATPAQAARHAAERAAFLGRWGGQSADPYLNPWWVQTAQPRRFLAAIDCATVLRRIAEQIGGPPGESK